MFLGKVVLKICSKFTGEYPFRSVISVKLHGIFSKHLFLRTILGGCFCEFQPPDIVKNYFTDAFQAFCTSSRSSHSKEFIYLKLIYYEVARCQLATLRKKLFYASSFMYFSFIFSEHIFFQKGLWKFESTNFFWKCKRKGVLLVIYLLNYDSSKSTLFMLNYGIWRSLEYIFYQINWTSLFLTII